MSNFLTKGKQALDVTGADVAAFCDERLRGTRSHIDKWRGRSTATC